MGKLAIHGGQPVKANLNPGMLRGAMVVGAEEEARVSQVVRSKSLNRYYGPDCQDMVKKLEDTISEQFNIPYVLGVTSGTAALVVALKALGIGYGDKVIVPANTFTATPGSVICANAVPVYCDIDETLNLDPDDLERVYDEEVKAILVVHINGQSCDMDKVMAFAKAHDLYVIEDVAQSLGCSYKGQVCGTIGDIGIYSFQMQKILTAGEGGAVVTRDLTLFERAVRYHDQGGFRDKARYGIEDAQLSGAFAGQNYRMSEPTGAIMLAQWEKMDSIIAAMRGKHKKIRAAVKAELPSIQFRKTVDEDGDICCMLGIALANEEQGKQFVEAMMAENLFCLFMYGGRPIYEVAPYFLDKITAEKNNFPFDYPFKHPLNYSKDMCPKVTGILQRTAMIPISPIMTDDEADEIIAGIIKVYQGLGFAD